MRATDISFLMNSGTYSGQTYKFTLATQNGQKMWSAQRVFNPAPSMYKEQIDVGILIRGKNINLGGAKELKRPKTLRDQLEIVAKESTYVTMMGFDGVSRDVRVDSTGYDIEPIVNEKSRAPEYVAKMRLWSMHQ